MRTTVKRLIMANVAASMLTVATPTVAQQFTMKLSLPTVNDVTHEYFKRMKASIEQRAVWQDQGRHLSGEPARPIARRRGRRGARHHRGCLFRQRLLDQSRTALPGAGRSRHVRHSRSGL